MGDFSGLAIRIKEMRTSLNQTQREFASFVGCTAATLSAYENGSKSPSLDIVKNIAFSCNVSIDWLCGLTDKMRYDEDLTTYSDLIKMVFQLYRVKVGERQMCFMFHEEHSETIGTFSEACGVLKFADKIMYEFFVEWEKMQILYEQKTIDDELYELWIEKTLKKYHLLIVPDDQIMT